MRNWPGSRRAGLPRFLRKKHKKVTVVQYECRNAYRVLVGKPEGKRSLGRPRRRWVNNIKMDLREVDCDPGDWIALAEDRDQWWAYERAEITSGFLKSQLVSWFRNV